MPISTNCIAVEKKNPMCQAILLLYYVEWVGAVKIGISLNRKWFNFIKESCAIKKTKKHLSISFIICPFLLAVKNCWDFSAMDSREVQCLCSRESELSSLGPGEGRCNAPQDQK